MPTPNSGTRPGSQTNSYVQSCASTMSGVDDRKLDEILGDGIQNQVCKKVFSTIGSHLRAKHCTKIHHQKNNKHFKTENIPGSIPHLTRDQSLHYNIFVFIMITL